MRTGVLVVLLLLASPLWALAQSPAPPAVAPGGAGAPGLADGALRLVVALFRHGVRAPLEEFNKRAHEHSGAVWPSLEDWKVVDRGTWGDLTKRGRFLVKELGRYYGATYAAEWMTKDFKTYLWADVDRRTIDTATAIAEGFKEEGIQKVTIASRLMSLDGKTTDPLFHAFKARCGSPNTDLLEQVATEADRQRKSALDKYAPQFSDLFGVLACHASPCVPLQDVEDVVVACPNAGGGCKAPLKWTGKVGQNEYVGKFPYASSASEAFLLE